MYENKTHTELLKKMKSAFAGQVNTGEGSFVESVLSPAALELVEAYIGMEQILKEAFPQTSSFNALKLKAEEYGLIMKDGESKEDLLERLLLKMQKPSASGNKNDYLNWARSVDGVGGVKVFPLKNGPGTVEVAVVGVDKRASTSELLEKVKSQIDQVRPIGANVTVVSGQNISINIEADLRLQKGYTVETVMPAIEKLISQYFDQISFELNYVSSGHIGRLMFEAEGVIDYENLTINGQSSSLELGDYGTPVIGVVSLNAI